MKINGLCHEPKEAKMKLQFEKKEINYKAQPALHKE
jgi:hypothetical protein